MASGSLLQIYPFSTKPSAPPTGSFIMYVKTDDTIYLQDDTGTEYPFGSTAAITALTGDVSATGPGSVTATVNFVGGQSAAAVASAATAVAAATSANTPNTLIERDASGNFSANVITASLNGNATTATTAITSTNFTGSLSGDVTGTQSATVVSMVGGYTAAAVAASVIATQAATSTNTASTIVKRDASGNFAANIITAALNGNATTATTATNFTGSLSGDVTGTQSATVVSYVDSYTAAAVGTSVAATQAATSTNAASTLVLRDASGNFSANVITASLSGNATTATTAITSTNFTGSLSGDVTGTQSATSIASTVVTGKLLTGYVIGSNVAISATDSILSAFEKLQGQVSTTIGAAITALTGDVSATGPGSVVATIESIQGTTVSGTTGSGNVVFSASPTLTGTLHASAGLFSSTLSASNLSGTNTGDVTLTNTNSINLAFTSGQSGLQASLNLSVTAADANNLKATYSIKSDGLFIEYAYGTPVQIGTTNSSGSASGFALYDHVHAITAPVVLGLLLTGYTVGTNTPLTATNSLLTAFENLQAQINATTGAAITALTGDVTASGPGSVAATVTALQGHSVSTTAPTDAQLLIWNNSTSKYVPESLSGDVTITNAGVSTVGSVGGNSASSIATTVNTVAAATSLDTPSTLVLRDSSGNFSAGTITANLTGNVSGSAGSFTGSLLGDVTGTQGATLVSKIQGTAVSGTTGTGNVVFSASPTLTGTMLAATATFSGLVSLTDSATNVLTINSTSFIFDSVNSALGIGLQPAVSVMIDGLNTSGASKLVQMTGYGVGSTTGYRGRFARGTTGSPSAVLSGDILNALSGRGYGASQFAAASTGVINIVAGETFTNASNLTYLQFSTTPTGSVTSAEAMRVATTGVTLGPQSASTAVHQFNGGINYTTRTVTAATLTVDTTTTDYFIYTDSTSNAITVTLPAAINGRWLIIRDKTGQAATNHITITPPGSVTINGVNAALTIGINYAGWVLTSDGTNWTAHYIQPAVVPSQAISASAVDWSTGTVFTKTLSANTTFTFANAVAGQTIVIRLTNTASNYTVTWPTIKWPVQTTPVMTTGAFSDVYTIIYDGTTFYGSYVQNF